MTWIKNCLVLLSLSIQIFWLNILISRQMAVCRSLMWLYKMRVRGYPIMFLELIASHNQNNKVYLGLTLFNVHFSFFTWDGFLHSVKNGPKRVKSLTDPRSSVYVKLMGVEIESTSYMHRICLYIGPIRFSIGFYTCRFKTPMHFVFKWSNDKISDSHNPDLDGRKIGMDGEYGF